MTPLSIFFGFIGFCVVAWWVIGVLLFAFATPVYVAKGTPLFAKLISVFVSGWFLPWALLTVGRMPMSMITKQNPTQEDLEDLQEWMSQFCPCPECKARRGE